MKLTTALRLALLLGATHDAVAGRRYTRGRGQGKDTDGGVTAPGRGGGSGGGGGRGGGKQVENPADKTLILQLKRSKEETPAAACASAAAAAGASVAEVFETLNICTVAVPAAAAPASMATLYSNPRVLSAEEDGTMYATVTWGLDRIDQCELPVNNSFTKLSAAGVRVYVLDTGIQANHNEFAGRMPNNDNGNNRCGFVASSINEAIDTDGNGHG